MKRFISLSIAQCCIWVSPAFADLPSDINAVLSNKILDRAKVGVVVMELDRSTTPSKIIYTHNPDVPMIPASNMKILTSSAALDRLGPDFKFQTLLLQNGNDLILLGDGDPMFGDATALKDVGWDSTTVFKMWAEKLAKQGLTSFEHLYVDDSVFDQKYTHPDWNAGDLSKDYAAQISGMNLNAGVLDFYILFNGAGKPATYRLNPPTHYATIANTCMGSSSDAVILDRASGSNRITMKGTASVSSTKPIKVPINNPSLFAGTALQEVFAENGVKITIPPAISREFRTKVIEKDPSVKILAGHETTLGQILIQANKNSLNPYAESVCKRLGAAVSMHSGSWENGSAAIGEFLKKLGAADGSYKFVDGSGLAKANLVTTRNIALALEYDYRSTYWKNFLESLPVGGVDGTLEKRFDKGKTASLKERVFAKTGYISSVYALSGYLKAQNDKWYAFSILMNNVSGGSGKELQEEIVLAIDRAAK